MTRVCVDADRCEGHGRCYTLAPDVFDADDVGHAIVRVENVSGELEAQGRGRRAKLPRRRDHVVA